MLILDSNRFWSHFLHHHICHCCFLKGDAPKRGPDVFVVKGTITVYNPTQTVSFGEGKLRSPPSSLWFCRCSVTRACWTGPEGMPSSLKLLFMPNTKSALGSLLSREEENAACDLTWPQTPFSILCLSGCL